MLSFSDFMKNFVLLDDSDFAPETSRLLMLPPFCKMLRKYFNSMLVEILVQCSSGGVGKDDDNFCFKLIPP